MEKEELARYTMKRDYIEYYFGVIFGIVVPFLFYLMVKLLMFFN